MKVDLGQKSWIRSKLLALFATGWNRLRKLCYGIYAGVIALGEKKVEVVLGVEYLASQMLTGESWNLVVEVLEHEIHQ